MTPIPTLEELEAQDFAPVFSAIAEKVTTLRPLVQVVLDRLAGQPPPMEAFGFLARDVGEASADLVFLSCMLQVTAALAAEENPVVRDALHRLLTRHFLRLGERTSS